MLLLISPSHFAIPIHRTWCKLHKCAELALEVSYMPWLTNLACDIYSVNFFYLGQLDVLAGTDGVCVCWCWEERIDQKGGTQTSPLPLLRRHLLSSCSLCMWWQGLSFHSSDCHNNCNPAEYYRGPAVHSRERNCLRTALACSFRLKILIRILYTYVARVWRGCEHVSRAMVVYW